MSLAEAIERPGERDRADDDVEDDEEDQPAVQARQRAFGSALAAQANEVVDGQERRGAAADCVEERDQLGHGGHRRPCGPSAGRPLRRWAGRRR